MVEREKKPYGYIYRATNLVNGKVYEGQTTAGRWMEGQNPIEGRWKEEVGEAYRKEARGEDLRYIENAIIKYGPENFEVVQQDIAYSQEELDEKETKYIRDYDSMNPDKGYNLKEGGLGGRLSDQSKEKLSNVITDKYQSDPEYHEKQTKERKERAIKNPEWYQKMTEINRSRAKDPNWLQKMTEINRERAKDPNWLQKMAEINQEIARNPQSQEKMSKSLTEKWKGSKYQESVSKGVTDKWKDEKYRERQARAKREGKREIPDKVEFLKDISEMMKKDINEKYDMDGKSINKRIEEMLKHQGVRTYSEAKKYLEDKNLNDVLKDIDDSAKESEPKPDSEKETPKGPEKSELQEKDIESPNEGQREEGKENIPEPSKGEETEGKQDTGVEGVENSNEQEISEDKTKADTTGEDISEEDLKPEESDYSGIDEGISKEGIAEKKSDIGGIMRTTPGYPGKYDTHNIEIKEGKEKGPKRKDGKVPKETSDVNPNSLALERRLATPPRSSEKEGKHKDLGELNINLNMEMTGDDTGPPEHTGFGTEGGGEGSDLDGITAEAIDEDKSEVEGESGSEGKERSWEV